MLAVIGSVVVGTLVLVAAIIGTARWAVDHTDVGLHLYARALNHRRPLNKGWRECP